MINLQHATFLEGQFLFPWFSGLAYKNIFFICIHILQQVLNYICMTAHGACFFFLFWGTTSDQNTISCHCSWSSSSLRVVRIHSLGWFITILTQISIKKRIILSGIQQSDNLKSLKRNTYKRIKYCVYEMSCTCDHCQWGGFVPAC